MHYLQIIYLSIAVGVVGLLSACGDGSSAVSRANTEQMLYFNIGGEVQNLDPHTVTGVPESRVLRALLEGLVAKNPQTLEAIPAAAESWSISEAGRRYTFVLRHDARWSNGDPLQAADFVYAWRRILDPRLTSEYAYNLFAVVGAEDYNQGNIQDFEQVGIKAIDKRTLEINLKAATPYFLQLLDHYSAFPLHPPTIERFGGIKRNTRWTHPENFIGNGPFILSAWKIHQKIVVHKNPLYWDAQNVTLQGITFYPIDNVALEERMFRSGALHVTSSLSAEKIAVYKQNFPEALVIHPSLGTYYYELNVHRPPLDKTKVRRALGHAINRQQIVQLLKGGQKVAHAFTPPNTSGYTPAADIYFDADLANQLLDEAGFENRADFPTLELLYNTSAGHRKIAVAVQQMWQQYLAIKVTLVNQEWKVYLQTRNNGDFQIARAGWIGDYPDPNNFLDLMMSHSGNNRSGWKNPDYDALINLANQSLAQTKRYELLASAEQLLMQEMPLIPIYIYNTTRLVHPNVKGWYRNPMDYHHYRDISLESTTTTATHQQ